MCSYNRVNGDFACENKWLLTDVLKKDWKFPGFVLSDWGGTHCDGKGFGRGARQRAAGAQFLFGDKYKAAVEAGKIPQAEMDEHVHRILRSMFAAGVIDHPRQRSVVDPFAGFETARKIEEGGIVLLKNKKRACCRWMRRKLQDHRGDRRAFGCGHDLGRRLGAGGSDGRQRDHASGQGRDALAGADLVSDFAAEGDPGAGTAGDGEVRCGHRSGGRRCRGEGRRRRDRVRVSVGERGHGPADAVAAEVQGDGKEVDQNAVIAAVAAANPHTIVVLETGSPVTMPWVDAPAAILEAWYSGSDGAEALGNVLFGTVNPSGKLPNTFPKSEADLPHPTVTQPPPASMHSAGRRRRMQWAEGDAGVSGVPTTKA